MARSPRRLSRSNKGREGREECRTSPLIALIASQKAEFVAELGDIYEHAPWVAEAVCDLRPFATLAALHEAMTAAVAKAPPDQRLALINGHPDLAGKAARAGTLTADSTAEQASAGLNQLSEQEFSDFHRLNEAYRTKFGIPFIVCVRRHSKDSILRQFKLRLNNDPQAEEAAALQEIFRITALRLDQRVDRRRPPQGARPDFHPHSRYLQRNAGARRQGRTARTVGQRRPPHGRNRADQRRWPHRRAADRRPAGADRPLRTAVSHRRLFRPARDCRWPTRRFSAWCRCSFRSRRPKATITCRCWRRRGATRPIAEADAAPQPEYRYGNRQSPAKLPSLEAA